MIHGCGVLFKKGSGIIICGEFRTDGNNFLCQRCLKEEWEESHAKQSQTGKEQ